MLEVKNIKTYYGNIQAIKGVSLEISEGEIITLIGANGAGKTTTLMSISGIVPPKAGEILFMGKPLQDLTPNQIVAQGISQVPEGRRIFPFLTVAENLDMGAFLRNDASEVQKDLEYVYELFPILANRRHQSGGTLSGGEQQMLAVGRALMARPRLLLLDEPSLGLAPLIVKQIFEIIRKVNILRWRWGGTKMYIIIGDVPMAKKVQSVYDRYKGEEVILVDSGSQRSKKLTIITGRVFHYLYPELEKISCRHYLPSYSRLKDGKPDFSREEVKSKNE